MRPQFFQTFVPLHAAQMGAPPVFSGHFEQHFSSTIPDESHVVYPFSFVYPWNAPGVSSFQGSTDIVMEDIFSDDMDVDPPKFHPSCAFNFPKPMDVDTPFIYATGEPMDVDTPPAVLELSALFHALTFADPSTIEPDSDSDVDYPHPVDSHPHPDDMALVLYNLCDKAVVLYNQNKEVILYTPTDKAVVLYNRNRDPVDVEIPLDTPPQETDLPEEYDFDQLIESFRRLVIQDDGPVSPDTKLSSSSVPTAHVPASVDANTKVPTNGSLQLSSNLERPFANSNIMYICTKCRAHSKGSEYVVEEVSSPTLERRIWIPYTPGIKNIPTSTQDRSCSESHATPLSRARRIRRMSHPYRRPQFLKTTRTEESNPTSESHSLPSLAKVDAIELNDLTLAHTDSSTDTTLRDIPHPPSPYMRAPCIAPEIEKIQIIKDIPRTPHRLYSESNATLPLPPRPRKTAHPYRRPRSLKAAEIDESFKKPASELDSSVQRSPKAASIGITKSDVVPGAYPISELERLESLYLNRPPLATFSPKYWRTVSQWVLELICGW